MRVGPKKKPSSRGGSRQSGVRPASGTTARLSPEKGLPYLIDAFSRLRDRYGDRVRLRIAGAAGGDPGGQPCVPWRIEPGVAGADHGDGRGAGPERGLMCLAVGGNIVTSWSWFGTNMLGVGLHSYGFTDSAFFALITFCLSQFGL